MIRLTCDKLGCQSAVDPVPNFSQLIPYPVHRADSHRYQYLIKISMYLASGKIVSS